MRTEHSEAKDSGDQRRSSLGLGTGFDASALGQDERKYNTSNPVVRRLIDRLCQSVSGTLDATSGSITDIGAGEGLALQRVLAGISHERRPAIAVEYRIDKVRRAAMRLPDIGAAVGDIGALPFADRSLPTVLCMEVLEHLSEPNRAVAEMGRITADHLIITVPYEPFFRLGNLCRGKNIKRFGNDPEHIQQFNRSALSALLTPHFGSVTIQNCFPWLLAVCCEPRLNP